MIRIFYSFILMAIASTAQAEEGATQKSLTTAYERWLLVEECRLHPGDSLIATLKADVARAEARVPPAEWGESWKHAWERAIVPVPMQCAELKDSLDTLARIEERNNRLKGQPPVKPDFRPNGSKP